MKPNYYYYFCFFGTLMSTVVLVSSTNYPIYDYLYMQEPCGYRVITPGQGGWQKYGFIRADNDGCYNPYKDCSIHVNASSGYHITMRFQYISTDCYDDVLQINGETGPTNYCGFYTPSYSIYSSSNWLSYRFKTNSVPTCLSGFSFYYTAYHTGECSDDEFKCSFEGRCIPEELKCDMYDNCGDWSDERSSSCGLTTGAIAAISVTCALVGLSCIAFIVYCLYDRSHRRRDNSTSRRGSTNRCAPQTVTEPVGPPNYIESPPAYSYTYTNTVYAGVYEELDDNKAPPAYQPLNNNAYPN